MPDETTRTIIGTNSPESTVAPAGIATGGSGQPDRSGFLHVIFHGLFCFFELDDYILVRVPFIPSMSMPGATEHGSAEVGDDVSVRTDSDEPCYRRSHARFEGCPSEHVYLAGNWLGELVLQPDSYHLKGVEHGYAHFDRDKNLVIQEGVPARNPRNLYAEIWLPYPQCITSVEQVGMPRTIFSGQTGRLSSEILSLHQVFTYKFRNEKHLQLAPHPWRPFVPRHPDLDQNVGGFIALHLFAEPDHKIPKHLGHAFTNGVQMFDKLTLKLEQDPPNPPKSITAADLAFGTRREEMLDLQSRVQTLAHLGLLRKKGGNLNSAFDQPAFITGSDPERCGGLIGG